MEIETNNIKIENYDPESYLDKELLDKNLCELCVLMFDKLCTGWEVKQNFKLIMNFFKSIIGNIFK